MSYPRLADLSVSKVRKIKKLMAEKRKFIEKAKRIQKRIRIIRKSAFSCLSSRHAGGRPRRYKTRIKVASQKINSMNGRFDVQFENPVVKKLTGMCFQVLRFVPKSLKRRLQYNGQWDDVAQTIYTTVVEFFRSKNGNLTTEISTPDYKALMVLANKNVRQTIHDLVAGFGHKASEKYLHPKRMNWIPVSNTGETPGYVYEDDLLDTQDSGHRS